MFKDSSIYNGQFIKDVADGNSAIQYEDQNHNLFKLHQKEDDHGNNLSGKFINGALTDKAEIDFKNGDNFKGMFMGGKPHGFGEMYYKNSVIVPYL